MKLPQLKAPLRNLLRHGENRNDPLPPVQVSHRPTVPAGVLHIVSAVLPLITLVLVVSRLPLSWGFVTPLLLVVAVILGLAIWLWPAVAPTLALVAIGLTALLGLSRPPTFAWGLAMAALSYLSLRVALFAGQLPRGALVERSVLVSQVWRDLAVLAVTALIGGIAVGAQRVTGCYATGVSVATVGEGAIIGQSCGPIGSLLVFAAALALLGLALGFAHQRRGRRSRLAV